MGDSGLKSNLIVAVVSGVLAFIAGVTLAFITVLVPSWIQRPNVAIKYIEAIPIAEPKSFNRSLFLKFDRLTRSLDSWPYIPDNQCIQQLAVNLVGPKCKEDIIAGLNPSIETQRASKKRYEEYLDNISKIDIRQAFSFPALKEDRESEGMVQMMNMGLGLLRSMERGVPAEQFAHTLYPLIANYREDFRSANKT